MNFLGIDLGTTNSVACTLRNGHFEYLTFHGSELLPSAILYRDNKLSVGSSAKKKAVIYAADYIDSAKTYMGTDKEWNKNGRVFTPTDVAAEVLGEIYRTARRFFGNDDPIQAVITTPAYFKGKQNEETKLAGERAGFEVKQILAEPVAAALAYGLETPAEKERIFVVDLGGGTFDVSLLEARNGNDFTTIWKDGDEKLGGDNFDKAVINRIFSHIRRTAGINLDTLEASGLDDDTYLKTLQKIRTEAEKTKIALSEKDEEEISIINLFPLGNVHYDLEMKLTRAEFLTEAAHLVKKVENTIQRFFDGLSIAPQDVDRVILVGGSANMPFVRECVKKFFGKDPFADKNLARLVAMGAALRADDESDAITLRDLIAHSLGIEVIGDRFEKILTNKMTYPNTRSKIFTTTSDYQEVVDINVFEGENEEDVNANDFYGGFPLEGIEKALAGVPQIEVTFSYDESCILHVTARDLNTNSTGQQDMVIHRSNIKKKIKQPVPKPFDIVLLLDNSGSMFSAMGTVKEACRHLVRELVDLDIHRICFITFESSATLRHHLTHDQDALINSINSVYAGNSTNMTDALNLAGRELANAVGEPLVILVTDGAPDSRISANSEASSLKSQGIKLAAIGAGSVDHAYLSQLTSTPGDYYAIDSMNDLADAFTTISRGLKIC